MTLMTLSRHLAFVLAWALPVFYYSYWWDLATMPSQIEVFDFWISPLVLLATLCIPLVALHIAAFLVPSQTFAWIALGIAMFFSAISTISVEVVIGASPLVWLLTVLTLYTGFTIGWAKGWRAQSD